MLGRRAQSFQHARLVRTGVLRRSAIRSSRPPPHEWPSLIHGEKRRLRSGITVMPSRLEPAQLLGANGLDPGARSSGRVLLHARARVGVEHRDHFECVRHLHGGSHARVAIDGNHSLLPRRLAETTSSLPSSPAPRSMIFFDALASLDRPDDSVFHFEIAAGMVDDGYRGAAEPGRCARRRRRRRAAAARRGAPTPNPSLLSRQQCCARRLLHVVRWIRDRRSCWRRRTRTCSRPRGGRGS